VLFINGLGVELKTVRFAIKYGSGVEDDLNQPVADAIAREIPPETTGFMTRVGRVLSGEVRAIHPRYLLAQGLVSFLPHNSLSRVRTLLYRMAGFNIGKRSMILGKLTLTADRPLAKMLSIGERSRINAPFYAELNATITIGSDVAIGHNVVFVTTDHDTSNPGDRSGPSKHSPIFIEDGAWVGACVTVLPGITIGKGSVVAAGSLVTQSVLPHKVVGGVPARPVKSLTA